MIEQTANNLLGSAALPVKHAQLYQGILKGIVGYEKLGDRLIQLLEHAYAFRQYDKLQELAFTLSSLPIESYRLIGQYYLAVAICRRGEGDMEMARPLIESVASSAPPSYRARAFLLLSAIDHNRVSYEELFGFYEEAIKVGRLDSTAVPALRGIAILKAGEGYHKQALNDLESIYPLARYAPPHIYFAYLNSYAVELCETGRLREAKDVSSLVISSPFADYYPEWQEVFSEVNRKAHSSRSTVTVNLPVRQTTERERVAEETKARIINFPKPKDNQFLRPSFGPPTEDETQEAVDRAAGLDPKQLLALVIKLVAQNRLSDAEIHMIVSVYYEAIVTASE